MAPGARVVRFAHMPLPTSHRTTRDVPHLRPRTHVLPRVFATALIALLASGSESPVRAASVPGFLGTLTDSSAVFSIPAVPRPAYRDTLLDPVFGTRLTRITADPGTALGGTLGTWGTDARQIYSKQQPWNATGTLISIENRGGAAASSPLLLDGETYQPVGTPCSAYDTYDYRWHPSPDHADEQINVNRAGTELMWFDVVRCIKTRTWTLPFAANYGIGSGEGNVSADGRFVVISDASRMVVVDMDPRAPNAPAYPHQRIGPVYTLPPCSLDVETPTDCRIGNISISPSGRYIDVKYGAVGTSCDTLCDMHRIFEVDTNLVIRPHRMANTSLRCGSFANRPNGWVFPLKHADMALDPFDNNEDVLIGGRACPGSTLGRVVKVRLRDGRVTSLTDPANEAGYAHGSARATSRPGWFYVSFDRSPSYVGRRFYGELVAVKLDGSGSVQRFGHYHSTASVYRAQAHGVPSPDGRRILFASDWAQDCGTGCGSKSVFGGYVLDARDSQDSIPPAGGKHPR